MAVRAALLTAVVVGIVVAPVKGYEVDSGDIISKLGIFLEEEPVDLVDEADLDPAEARLLSAGGNDTEQTEPTTTTEEPTGIQPGAPNVTDPGPNVTENETYVVRSSMTMGGLSEEQKDTILTNETSQDAICSTIAGTVDGVDTEDVECTYAEQEDPGRRLRARRLSATFSVRVDYAMTLPSAAAAQSAATALQQVADAGNWGDLIEAALENVGLTGYSIDVTAQPVEVGPSSEQTTTTPVPDTTTTAGSPGAPTSTAVLGDTTTAEEVATTTTTRRTELGGGSGASPSARAAVSLAVAMAGLLVPSLL